MWPAQEHAAVLRYRLLARGPDSQPEQVVVDVTGNLDGALADHPDGGEVLAIVCHAERRGTFRARSPISTGLPRDCPRPLPRSMYPGPRGGVDRLRSTCTRIRSGYVGELQPAVARRQPAVARRQPAGARAAPAGRCSSISPLSVASSTTGGRPSSLARSKIRPPSASRKSSLWSGS